MSRISRIICFQLAFMVCAVSLLSVALASVEVPKSRISARVGSEATEPEITYTFYLPSDPWGGKQGFYIVGLIDDTDYEGYRFNHNTNTWDPICADTVNKGEVDLYFDNMHHSYIYRIVSTNAVFVVVTSLEGSNVAVATPTCNFVGTEFTFVGDLYSRMMICRTVIFALEDDTEVLVEYTRHGESAPFATYENVLNAGEYDYIEQSSSGTVIVDIKTTADVMVYRLGPDNDELDVVMATSGTPFGETFYFAEISWYNNIFYLFNRADDTAEVELFDITDPANPVSAWSGTVEPHSMTHVYFGGTSFAHTEFWKIESTETLFILSGGYYPGQLEPGQPVYGFGLDSYHRFFSLYENMSVFKTNMIYSNGMSLLQEFMMFVVTAPTGIDVDPAIDVTNNGINYILAGNITSGTSTDTTIELTVTGSVEVKQDGSVIGTYGSGTVEIQLSTGSHTLSVESASGSAELIGINLDQDACFVWNLNHVPSKSGPFSDFIWTFEADNKIQFYHGGNGNCWVLTVMPMLYDYNIELRSGEIETETGQQLSLVHKVDPGEVTVFHIQAWNLGMEKDCIQVSCSFVFTSPSEGWSARLNTELVGPLNAGEFANFTLTVRAPSIGVSYGDFSVVTIHGRSVGDANVTDTITAVSLINISLDFALNVEVPVDPVSGDKIVKISPDAQKIITMSITNLGNINDTYDLALLGIPPGWEITFANNKHTMNISLCAMKYSHLGSAEALPIIILHAPVGAVYGDTAAITVHGISRLSAGSSMKVVERTDTFKIVVEESKVLKMRCDENMKHVNPGEAVTYQITISNLGNTPLDVSLYVEGVHLHEWVITIIDKVHLNPQQYVVTELVVSAPSDSMAETRLSLIVVAKVVDDPSITATVEIITIVNQIHEFHVTVCPSTNYALPGSIIKYNITLINLGNGEETFALHVIMQDMNWDYVFLRNRYVVSMLDLDPQESANITLAVMVPESALVDSDTSTPEIDNYEFLINVSTESQWKTFKMTAIVNPVYSATLSCGENNQTIDPGNTVTYLIEIINTGNTYETIQLQLRDVFSLHGEIEQDWLIYFLSVSNVPIVNDLVTKIPTDFVVVNISSAKFDVVYIPKNTSVSACEMCVVLRAGQTAYVTVAVVPHRTTVAGTYTVKLDATCIENQKTIWNNYTAFTTCVLNSDLIIVGDIACPSKVSENDMVSLKVNVRNVGEIAALNIVVVLYIDNRETQRKEICRIEPGKSSIVGFTWRATAGKHEVKVIVDPADLITEANEDNNVNRCVIEVEGEKLFLSREEGRALLVGILIIIALIAGFLVIKKLGIPRRRYQATFEKKTIALPPVGTVSEGYEEPMVEESMEPTSTAPVPRTGEQPKRLEELFKPIKMPEKEAPSADEAVRSIREARAQIAEAYESGIDDPELEVLFQSMKPKLDAGDYRGVSELCKQIREKIDDAKKKA